MELEIGDTAMRGAARPRGGPERSSAILDDAMREYAYGPAGGLQDTRVGAFPDGLMAPAKKNGWFVISMEKDWKQIFSFDK